MTLRRWRFARGHYAAHGAKALGEAVSSWVPDTAVMRYADGESSWVERLTLGAARAVSVDVRRRMAAWRSLSDVMQDLLATEREGQTEPRVR
jgi:hypothetical protein